MSDIADVYVHYHVLLRAFSYFTKFIPKEAMGFLIGDRFKYNNKEYVEIIYFIPVKGKASEVYVEPLEGSLGLVSSKIAKVGKNLIIVGWAHSHPGYGCFLSDVDLETQRKYFYEPFHVAMVIDPISGQYDLYKLKEDGSYTRPYFKVVMKVGKRYKG